MKQYYFKNLNSIRAVAILLILCNHSLRLLGQNHPSSWSGIALLQNMGGDLGVNLFFLMSGFGIYCSLRKMEDQGELSFGTHMKKRLQRILPEYYLLLFTIVVARIVEDFVEGSVASGKAAGFVLLESILAFGKKEGWDVLAHLLLLQNIFPGTAQGLSGPLWALGTIFQFYLIAIILFHGLERWGIKLGFFSIAFTILAKAITFFWIGDFAAQDLYLFFWAGRNLLTSVLDEFVVGMCLAKLLLEKEDVCDVETIAKCVVLEEKYRSFSAATEKNENKKIKKNNTIILISSLVAIVVWTIWGNTYGLGDAFGFKYYYHSVLNLLLACFVYAFLKLEIRIPILHAVLGVIADCEYSIYLWHFFVMEILMQYVGWYQVLARKWEALAFFLVLVILIIWSKIIAHILKLFSRF